MKSKICGISDIKTLKYLANHPFAPEYIGFIINYPKSKRFVKFEKLKKLLKDCIHEVNSDVHSSPKVHFGKVSASRA